MKATQVDKETFKTEIDKYVAIVAYSWKFATRRELTYITMLFLWQPLRCHYKQEEGHTRNNFLEAEKQISYYLSN